MCAAHALHLLLYDIISLVVAGHSIIDVAFYALLHLAQKLLQPTLDACYPIRSATLILLLKKDAVLLEYLAIQEGSQLIVL